MEPLRRDNVERFPERRERSVASLLSDLARDFSLLIRQEVALAKAEFAESVASVKSGIAALALSGALLVAGMLALLAAVILALSEVVQPWLAALIVGAVLAVAGFVLMQGARRKLSSAGLKPERTRESLRRDAQFVARRTS